MSDAIIHSDRERVFLRAFFTTAYCAVSEAAWTSCPVGGYSLLAGGVATLSSPLSVWFFTSSFALSSQMLLD